MKVAVIGGGIAGNVAACHLAREHDVHLFESRDHLDGHAHTHDIESAGETDANEFHVSPFMDLDMCYQ
ncbi:MAG TPA: FAD-dependent oxidoreductase [Gammaproteobacteria bacterium]|jgi:predicted NAD/FAD-binding protein